MSGKKVFTNGCFDVLHIGHVKYLQEAKSLGDQLIVGLNSDQSVSELKGEGRPINKEEHRKEMLLALSCVDQVCIFSEPTPLNLILKIKPDILVKGGDYDLESIVGAKEVLSWGGEVKSLSFYEGFSTSETLDKIIKL